MSSSTFIPTAASETAYPAMEKNIRFRATSQSTPTIGSTNTGTVKFFTVTKSRSGRTFKPVRQEVRTLGEEPPMYLRPIGPKKPRQFRLADPLPWAPEYTWRHYNYYIWLTKYSRFVDQPDEFLYRAKKFPIRSKEGIITQNKMSYFDQEVYDTLVANYNRKHRKISLRSTPSRPAFRPKLRDYFSNPFEQLFDYSCSLVDSVDDTCEEYPLISLPTKGKFTPHDGATKGSYVFVPPPVRDPQLISKLRTIIRDFRCNTDRVRLYKRSNLRSSAILRFYLASFLNIKFKIQPQADEKELAPTEVQDDHQGNVCLVSQREDSCVSIPTTSFNDSIAAGEESHVFPTLSERWILFDTVTWKNDSQLLADYILPGKALAKLNKSPNMLPFQNYTYWRGDVEIKVQINSNKFQIGQLQVSWLYDTLGDAKAALRENLFSLSQAPHALVNAGSSNPACLFIPFKSPYVSLPITTALDDPLCLNLGRLQIRVLAPLTTPDTVNNACHVSIYIRFPNAKFYGMRASDVGIFVEPQMFSAMAGAASVAAAEAALTHVLPTRNLDNPPITGAKMPMVPQATQSLCAGDNIAEITNTLRLDPTGHTPHLAQETADEMEITHVVRKFGLVNMFKWKADFGRGKRMASYDASPMWDQDDYASWLIESNTVVVLPPVGFISGLFAYWRGTLEMRVDFVASQFHTGRLIVAYVPRNQSNPTLDQVISGPHMSFDLAESQSFTFTVPYITNRYWWPRRIGYQNRADYQDAPGRVHIFVQNPLVPMEAVSNSIQANVYWRAGNDFEVAIPAQPSMGTSFWTTRDEKTKLIQAEPGYYPWYWGYYGNFHDGKKAIARYGPGWQHVAQFFNTNEKAYYSMDPKTPGPKYKTVTGELVQPQWFGPINLYDGQGGVYMGIFANEENAKLYASKIWALKDTSLFVDVYPSDEGDYCEGNPIFIEHKILTPEPSPSSQWEYIQPQGDERDNSINNCNLLPQPMTGVGRMTFGESFNSLKSLCRRYQPYATAVAKTDTVLGNTMFSVPLLPQGLDLTIEAEEKRKLYYTKYIRDGVIPLICSGYRFFRGGMRLQFITGAKDVKPDKVWVQHRPDYDTDKLYVTTAIDKKSGNGYFNTGYAMTVQVTSVNTTFNVEVPFYKPYAYTYLQRPNTKRPHVMRAASLGMLNVGIESSQNKEVDMTILYSFADDAMCSVFQGFAPVILLDRIPPPSTELATFRRYIQPQMFKKMCKAIKPNFKLRHTHDVNVNCDNLLPSVTAVSDFVKPYAADGAISSVLGQLSEVVSRATGKVINFGLDLITSIGHYILNPTAACLALIIGGLLLKLEIIHFELLDKIVAKIRKVLDYIGFRSTSKLNQESEAEESVAVVIPPQGVGSDAIISYINAGFAAVSTLCLVTINPPKNLNGFRKLLTQDLSNTLRTSNFLFTFLRNNINLFKDIVMRATCLFNKDKLFKKTLVEDFPAIVDWLQEAQVLLDPVNDEKIYGSDSSWADRLEYNYGLGLKLNEHFVDNDNKDRKQIIAFNAFTTVFNKIMKKREVAMQRGISSVSRREPFCIWVAGEPGCGKSQLAQIVMLRLLNMTGIKWEGEPIYTLPSGAKYWNGCRNQPGLYMDDFLNVRTGDIGIEAVRHYFAIKSPAPLVPEQAHVDAKERRYAPELYWLNSNFDFPRLPNIEEEALYRRRDILIKAELIPKIVKAGFNNLTSNKDALKRFLISNRIDMKNFEHLQFWVAVDPSNSMTQYHGPFNFGNLYQQMLKDFLAYRHSQLELFKIRMSELHKTVDEERSYLTMKQLDTKYKSMVERLQMNVKELSYEDRLHLIQITDSKDSLESRLKLVEAMVAKVSAKAPQPEHLVVPQVGSWNTYHHVKTLSILKQHFTLDYTAVNFSGCEDEFEREVVRNSVLYTVIRKWIINTIYDISALNEPKFLESILPKFTSADVNTQFAYQLEQLPNDKQELIAVGWALMWLDVNLETVFKSSTTAMVDYTDVKRRLRVAIDTFFELMVMSSLVKWEFAYLIMNSVNLISGKDCDHTYFDYEWNFNSIAQAFVLKDRQFSETSGCEQNCAYSYDLIRKFVALNWYFNQPNYTNLTRSAKPPSILSLVPFDPIMNPEKTEGLSVCAETSENAESASTVVEQCQSLLDEGEDTITEHIFPEVTIIQPRDQPTPEPPTASKLDIAKEINNPLNAPKLAIVNSVIKKNYPSAKFDKDGVAIVDHEMSVAVKPKEGWKTTKWFDKYMLPPLRVFWKIVQIATPFLTLFAAIYGLARLTKQANPKQDAAFITGLNAAHTIWHNGVGPKIHAKAQVHSSGDYKNQSASKPKLNKPLTSTYVKPQIGYKLPYNDQLRAVFNKIIGNVYYVGLKSNKGIFYNNKILFICDNTAMMLRHYVDAWMEEEDDPIIRLYKDKFEVYDFRLKDLNVTTFENQDICFVKFRNIPFKKNIISLIATREDHEKYRASCYILEANFMEPFCLHSVEVSQQFNRVIDTTSYIAPSMLYGYNWEGMGRCGSILIDPYLHRPIIGFHNAGTAGMGYAEPVHAEMFTGWVTKDIDRDNVAIDFENPVVHARMKGNFTPLGLTAEGMEHHQSGVTRILPSMMHDKIFGPHVTEPNPLSKGDVRVQVPDGEVYSPLWAGVENMCKPTQNFPKEVLDRAVEVYTQRLLINAKPMLPVKTPLTYNEAICGIPGFMKGIEMSTSEGFPFSRWRPVGEKSKKWLFQLKEQDSLYQIEAINTDLLNLINHKNVQRKSHTIPVTVFDDCLKDARLKIEKNKVYGKTRIFSTSPVDYTIVSKQYMGEFQMAFINARLKIFHAVGIAADGPEWGQLVRYLDEIDGVYITGDYTNFGPGLNSTVLQEGARIMLAWYKHNGVTDERVFRILDSLIIEGCTALHCTGDIVWQALAGLPSGCPFTVEWNSIVNVLYIICMWQMIFENHALYHSIHYFFSLVRLVVYGDDLIMKVSHEIKDLFNNLTLQKKFAEFDIKFTDASKSGNKPYEISLSECTFLKRGFAPHPKFKNEYLAPLDEIASVKESVNWVHAGLELKKATEIAIESCCTTAYSLGPIKHKEIFNKLNQALLEMDSNVVLRSWSELDRIFFKNYYAL